MSPKWRLIARQVSISISMIALIIGIGYYILLQQWNLFMQVSLGIFVIGVAVYVALNPSAIRKALSGRQARHGSNALILLVAFFGILVVINYLVSRNTRQWDLTADQSNTLSKETLEVLSQLSDPVVAKAYYTRDATLESSKESAKALLDQYVYEAGGKFQYEFIDPNKDPVSAQESGITKDGSVVLYMGTSKQALAYVSEQELSGAIVRLMNPGKHVVYFLSGHGEDPLAEGGDQSYSQLKSTLESKNYTVSSLNLLASGQIPQDASVIVVAGPDKPLDDSEVDLLVEYLQGGGSAVIMQEPPIVTQFGDAADPLADYLAQTFGIVFGNDMVVDLQSAQSLQQPFIAIANQYGQHAITQKMAGMASLYPTTRSILIDEAVASDYSKTSLVMTADQSWAETDMASIQDGSMKPDESVDLFGPITVSVAVEGINIDTRLVIFGDSDFALNANYGIYGNGDIIVNSIDWAAKEESLINLTPKATIDRYLIQPTPYMIGMLLLGSLILLPGVIIIAGVGTWIVRRRQG